uniref:Head-tail joining protein n=1 Tax=viral metagenome TaxID=1070528 RepID=A0A6H1ZNW1_9ZZZZ
MSILGEQAVTLTRYTSCTVGTDGRGALAGGTATTIMASMQPPTDRQLQRLPEGLRQRVTLMAYTEDALRTTDHMTALPGDRITYRGETYEVGDVKHWPTAGPLPHYEAALTRVDETGGTP